MANSPDRNRIAILIAVGVLLLAALAVVVCLAVGLVYFQRTAQTRSQPQRVTVEVTREVMVTPPTAVVQAATALIPTQPPPATVAATAVPPTAVPPTPVPPTAAPTPNVVYGNVSLTLDPWVAGGVNPVTVPASPPVQDGPYWDVYPQYIELNLSDYVLPDTFHKPRISVYPVAAFEQMSEPAKEVIASTRKLLKDRPAQVEQIPSLPIWNAGQVFHARLHYIDFKNGSGVVFLSEYAQYFAPINNHDMFYNFQGMTSDGQYYIVGTLPASHPNLIPNSDISQQDWQKLADDYPGYLNQIIPMLESQTPNSFTPPLDKLDAVLQSLNIQ